MVSRLEKWPHKRFACRHALEHDYSGYGGHFLRAPVCCQPRPQGFSLKKWVGRHTHFLREKPWGRGWFAVSLRFIIFWSFCSWWLSEKKAGICAFNVTERGKQIQTSYISGWKPEFGENGHKWKDNFYRADMYPSYREINPVRPVYLYLGIRNRGVEALSGVFDNHLLSNAVQSLSLVHDLTTHWVRSNPGVFGRGW